MSLTVRLKNRLKASDYIRRQLFLSILTALVILQTLTLISIRNTSEKSLECYEEDLAENGEDLLDSDPDPCQERNVALLVWNMKECREAAGFLKTLLRQLSVRVHVHFIVNNFAGHVLKTLLSTWSLNNVAFTFYDLPLEPHEMEKWLMKRFEILKIIPASIDKVVFLSNDIRLLHDVRDLFESAKSNPLTISERQDCKENKIKNCFLPKIIIFDRRKLADAHVKKLFEDPANTASDIANELRSKVADVPIISCEWNLELNPNITDCLNKFEPKAVVAGGTRLRDFSGNFEVERVKEYLKTVLWFPPRLSPPVCDLRDSKKGEMSPTFTPYKDNCDLYRYISRLKQRTHLYFLGDKDYIERTSEDNRDPYDVTAVIQTSINRFTVLERVLERWKGPAAVVFFVTDLEAEELDLLISRSRVLRHRKKTIFHVVYKREPYNTINYLRNVGLENIKTPYLLSLDVDLVPNPGLYQSIKDSLASGTAQNNELFMVAAFEAVNDPGKHLAENKSELLKAMDKNEVFGYRMNRSWNLGHKPTNFTLWQKTDTSYLTVFKDAFEPYVVVPRELPARYNEDLLERMGDKIGYARLLHGMGFSFRVLPNDFIVHLPHAVSQDKQRQKLEPYFFECGSVIFESYRRELYQRFPNRTF